MWPFAKKQPTPPRRPMRRHYNAAKIGRLTSGWTTATKSPDEIIDEALPALRARSREQFANNDYMARFVSLVTSNVVGPKGIRLQSTPLGSNGQVDRADAEAIENAYQDFGRKGVFDVTGTLSMVDAQRLIMSTLVIDGEVFIREHIATGPHGYQVQLIDPEKLPVTHNVVLDSGNVIKASIEYTGYGKPVAYYVLNNQLPTNSYGYAGKKYERISADEMIHAFIPQRVDQRRGIPLASTALMRMNMLEGYEDAAITAARVGAAKMGFFTSQAGDGYIGDGTDSDGAIISEVEPGIMEQLPEGVDFKSFDPDYPHAQFPEFVKATLRGIASGLGVSYNALANDLEGVNYSSIRSGVLEDREAWKALQDWLIETVLHRVFTGWLEGALLSKKIVGPTGIPLPKSRLDKFSRHAWQPRRWAWVDPLKDTQANVMAISAGLKSRGEVIREQGGDPSQVWEELTAEAELLAGIVANEAQENGTETVSED